MNELKTYHLSYNRYENKVITYSTSDQAERSGSPWKTIEASSHTIAKTEFLEWYASTEETE